MNISRNVRISHTNYDGNLQKFLAFFLCEIFFKTLYLQPDPQSKDLKKKQQQDPSIKKTTHVVPPRKHSQITQNNTLQIKSDLLLQNKNSLCKSHVKHHFH
jgi:hypothetical protein